MAPPGHGDPRRLEELHWLCPRHPWAALKLLHRAAASDTRQDPALVELALKCLSRVSEHWASDAGFERPGAALPVSVSAAAAALGLSLQPPPGPRVVARAQKEDPGARDGESP